MRLMRFCPELVIVFTLITAWIKPVQAVTINFEAALVNASCTLSLDRSTLPLGTILLSQLRANSLVSPSPFTLSVQNCSSVHASQEPAVRVTGVGVTQDSKWLFRHNVTGSAKGVGILIIQSDSVPNYASDEVRDGTRLLLKKAGNKPVDQTFTFYAGGSCGGSSGCSTTEPGRVTASVMFSFVYQ